jgi:hypothetical protein
MNAHYLEDAARERISENLRIAEQVRLEKIAEGGNRRKRSQQFHDWIGYVGRVLAARHGAEPNAVKGRA